MQIYDLRALRDCADMACDAAEHDEDSHLSAVNWADLSCVSAEHWRDDEGNEGYRVLIEEADPSAWNLKWFVMNYLKERGFEDIEVLTEW